MNLEIKNFQTNSKNSDFKISLCIPTYNRGKLAYYNAKHVTKNLKSNWELVVLNNGSNNEEQYYNKINKISKKVENVNYILKPQNTEFVGNFIDSFKFSTGKYIFFISDEDRFNFKNFAKLIGFLDENPDLIAVRPSISNARGEKRQNAFKKENRIFEKGYDALVNFSIWNSYLTGMVYNREKVIDLGLLKKLEKRFVKNRFYPHIYLDMLASAKCRVATSSISIATEGKAQNINPGNLKEVFDDWENYYGPYTLGSRLDQFIVERDGLHEATCLINDEFNTDIFFNAYLQLCVKFLRNVLIANMPMYEKHNINILYLNETVNQFLISSIRNYKNFEFYAKVLTSEIRRISKAFVKVYLDSKK